MNVTLVYGVPWNRLVGRCDIERNGKVVIVSELQDNPGASVTNAIEHIAMAICGIYSIKLDELVLIEHYPEPDNTYDLVTLEIRNGKAVDAGWSRISEEVARDRLATGV